MSSSSPPQNANQQATTAIDNSPSPRPSASESSSSSESSTRVTMAATTATSPSCQPVQTGFAIPHRTEPRQHARSRRQHRRRHHHGHGRCHHHRHEQHRDSKERSEDLPNCPPLETLNRELFRNGPPTVSTLSDTSLSDDPYEDIHKAVEDVKRLRDGEVRRRQSILRHEQHRDSKERSADLPNCPPPEKLKRELYHSDSYSTISSESRSSVHDPYEDLNNLLRVLNQQAVQQQDTPRPPSPPAQPLIATKSVQAEQQQDTPRPPPPLIATKSIQAQSSPILQRLRRELQELLTARPPRGGEEQPVQAQRAPSDIGPPCIAQSSSRTIQAALPAPIVVEQAPVSTGGTMTAVFGVVQQMVQFVIQNKLAQCGLVLLFLYLFSGTLGWWLASLFASSVGWIWPPAHFFLTTISGLFWHLADWVAWMDEFWRNMICDMANSYCLRYGILCDRQCSFTDRAVEHEAAFGYSGRRRF